MRKNHCRLSPILMIGLFLPMTSSEATVLKFQEQSNTLVGPRLPVLLAQEAAFQGPEGLWPKLVLFLAYWSIFVVEDFFFLLFSSSNFFLLLSFFCFLFTWFSVGVCFCYFYFSLPLFFLFCFRQVILSIEIINIKHKRNKTYFDSSSLEINL